MRRCEGLFLFDLLSTSPCFRFKRTGPNAMRGRGIGTARGRATIMRGMHRKLAQILECELTALFLFNF